MKMEEVVDNEFVDRRNLTYISTIPEAYNNTNV
jgi:hypothetical protein